MSAGDGEADWVAQVADTVQRELGRAAERIEPIPGALGLRRFARVRLGGEPASLLARVDTPEDPAGRPEGIPPEPPLEPVRALLESAGLPVPRRFGADEAAGIELLEDLGRHSLADAVQGAEAGLRRRWYREVCDWIPRLQALRDPGGVPAFARRLDAAHFAYKADLFSRYSLPGPTPAQVACVTTAFTRIGEVANAAPQRLAHRDLQSQNVLLHDGRLGLIDLQGALCTAPEYDLVCLLRDSYVELPAEEITEHFERTRQALPDAADAESSRQRFDCLTLTRKGKDHARFLYAAHERGDRRYLAFLPATLRHLRAAAAAAARRDPELAELAELVHGLPEPPCGR